MRLHRLLGNLIHVDDPVILFLTVLCFDLEQIRDHFYSWDPPMAVGKSGLGFALSQSIAE